MSHDRGCHCGREKWDQADCPDPDCWNKPGWKERAAAERAAKVAAREKKQERKVMTATKHRAAFLNENDVACAVDVEVRDGMVRLAIERPHSSDDMTVSVGEAEALRGALLNVALRAKEGE